LTSLVSKYRIWPLSTLTTPTVNLGFPEFTHSKSTRLGSSFLDVGGE